MNLTRSISAALCLMAVLPSFAGERTGQLMVMVRVFSPPPPDVVQVTYRTCDGKPLTDPRILELLTSASAGSPTPTITLCAVVTFDH